MFDFLDKLRRKPKPVRERIALVTTAALSFLIFSVWWTTFTVSGSEKAVSVEEALSPVGAMAEMASVAGNSFKGFTESLKSHVLQVQYEAPVSDPAKETTANEDVHPRGIDDVVYPEDIYTQTQNTGKGANAASNE